MRKIVLLFLVLSQLVYAPQVYLPRPPRLPSFDDPNIRRVVGLRPKREESIRLEHEKLNGLNVVHNYGHGGAGITLSIGTALESIDLASKFLDKKAVVIGGGVIGLTTAKLLQEMGIEVTIYSAEFFPNNVSNIAGGLWSPVSVNIAGAEAERWKRIQLKSYEKFIDLSKKGWPVYPMPMFVTENAREKSGIDFFEQYKETFKLKHYEQLPIYGLMPVPGYGVETLLIETPIYMKRLLNQVKAGGARIIQKKFTSFEEVARHVPPGSTVFNCTGLGARELAQDLKVIPVRGALLRVYQKYGSFPVSRIPYMLFYGSEGTDYMFPHPQTGRIVLGGSFEENDWGLDIRQSDCVRIYKAYGSIFKP